jgi:lysophospholipase
MKYFGEDDFSEKMEQVVAPWLEANVQEGTIIGKRDVPLHWYGVSHPQERAAVLVVHGFCEYFGKYHEMIYYLWQAGYSVYFLDQRGHGFSGRETEKPDAVYVKSFDDYVEDQKTFLEKIVKQQSSSQRFFLLAHSMGGLVGALMLEAYPNLFEKAVLSCPMIRINYGNISPCVVQLLTVWATIAHRQKKYVPGAHDFDGTADFDASSQRSKSRFARILRQRQEEPHCQTNGATYGWTMAAIKASKLCEQQMNQIQIPVLLMEAGEDTKVDIAGEEFFLEHTQKTRIERFPESRHEIFHSVQADRERFYEAIFAFYGEK